MECQWRNYSLLWGTLERSPATSYLGVPGNKKFFQRKEWAKKKLCTVQRMQDIEYVRWSTQQKNVPLSGVYDGKTGRSFLYGRSKSAILVDSTKNLLENRDSKSDEETAVQLFPYREAVGALLYLALSTRPDLCYAEAQFPKRCHDPNAVHWDAVTKIFSFLNGTKNLGIWLGRKSNAINGLSNADFAGD